MFVPAPILAALLAVHQASSYKIVEIDRTAIFAGKLGQLVHESLVIERDGKRYTITVRGDYHTTCVHPNQRLREGDEVRLSSPLSEATTSVTRDSIRRIRG